VIVIPRQAVIGWTGAASIGVRTSASAYACTYAG